MCGGRSLFSPHKSEGGGSVTRERIYVFGIEGRRAEGGVQLPTSREVLDRGGHLVGGDEGLAYSILGVRASGRDTVSDNG